MCNYHIPPSYLRKALYIYTKDGIILLTALDLVESYETLAIYGCLMAVLGLVVMIILDSLLSMFLAFSHHVLSVYVW